MALTVLKVKNAKPGRHVDGRGLCLVVKPSGARTWVLRMQLKGHRRDYGLGSAHDVSLGDARTAAAELRRRVRDGFDPVAERRKARKVIPTFEAATRTCHETLGDGWKGGHHTRWLSGFERHLFPASARNRSIRWTALASSRRSLRFGWRYRKRRGDCSSASA
ncbi:Arm DNA-binding domain-containing protein [Novosphingobium pokkalii]|uniref:Arm DNA-binding domain-containing protein n=1 Tax=Novosphingobium pokkalii TaxID=1770194 RepID=UPI0036386339